TSSTSPKRPPSSTCRTGWPAVWISFRTASITGGTGDPLSRTAVQPKFVLRGLDPAKTNNGGNRRAIFAHGPGMRRFFVGFFAVIGFATVLFVAGVMLLVGGLKP